MTDSKPLAIYAAIAAIQEGVGTIPKLGRMDFRGTSYNFVRNDDILEAVSKLLIKHKVIVQPELSEFEYVERVIGENRISPLARVKLTLRYISTVDGSTHTVVSYGEGSGSDDKALRKAVTQAQKIANLLTFSIATGEPDPDGIPVEPISTQAAPTRAQNNIAAAKVDPLDTARSKVKAAAGKKNLGIDAINALGESIDKDFFFSVEHLTTLLKKIESVEVAKS